MLRCTDTCAEWETTSTILIQSLDAPLCRVQTLEASTYSKPDDHHDLHPLLFELLRVGLIIIDLLALKTDDLKVKTCLDRGFLEDINLATKCEKDRYDMKEICGVAPKIQVFLKL